MRMSSAGLRLLREWEGSSSQAYPDTDERLTIGVGHLLTPAELSSERIVIEGVQVEWRKGLTDDQVDSLLRSDLLRFEKAVNREISIELTQGQFDALVSFAFNVGETGMANSELVTAVNDHKFDQVPAKFLNWVHNDAGDAVEGLVNRRNNEVKLFFNDNHASGPSEGQTSTYTVKAGETLIEAATKLGVDAGELADLNNIINPADFVEGRIILVPAASRQPAPTPQIPVSPIAALSTPSPDSANDLGNDIDSSGPNQYRVQANETLVSVAEMLDVDAGELAGLNNIINPADFVEGLVLAVPSGTTAKSHGGRLGIPDRVKNVAGHGWTNAKVQRQSVRPTVARGVGAREQVDHIQAVQQFGIDLGLGIAADGKAGPLTYRLTHTLQVGMILGPYRHNPLKFDGAPGPATTAMLEFSRENGFRCSESFRWEEFATNNPDWVVSKKNAVLLLDRDLIILTQNIRDHVGFPFSPISAYRDPDWNTIRKGATASQHMFGKAIDIDSNRLRLSHETAVRLGAKGIGIVRATGFVAHVDTRTKPETWYYPR